ncbi:MAG: ParB/RepB/Spo0J family partition protein [Solirubrobacteraceae bacterium]
MVEKNKGMGRGLAAILAAVPRDDYEELRQIPLELISPNPHQPRRQFDEQGLISLADSIRARGVIQPVLVRSLAGGRYELVAGERRWRAAQLAQLDSLPAVVRERDDAQSLELAVIENMAREDLNPVEQARACAGLVEELGLTREEVGLRVGRSRVAVSNLMRLLELPDEALELLQRGDLTEGHGRALLLAADNAVRRTLARRAAQHGWSVRELEARARAAQAPDGQAAAGDGPVRAHTVKSDPHPDQVQVAGEIADRLGAVLGVDVTARPARRGYTVQIVFASAGEALELARRLGG